MGFPWQVWVQVVRIPRCQHELYHGSGEATVKVKVGVMIKLIKLRITKGKLNKQKLDRPGRKICDKLLSS